MCDTAGNFLDALVVSADTDERTCALALLLQIRKTEWGCGLQTIFADAGFAGREFEEMVSDLLGQTVQIVRRDPDHKGFMPLPKRWLIEQVFGCQGRNRRLARDYEQTPRHSRATLQAANIHRWLRRLKPAPSNDPPLYPHRSRSAL